MKKKKVFYISIAILVFILIIFVLYKIGENEEQKAVLESETEKLGTSEQNEVEIENIKEKLVGKNTVQNTSWVLYKDPHGFSITKPTDWQVKVDSSGLILIGADPSTKKGPIVFMETLISSEPQTNQQVLDSVKNDLKKVFPNFEIVNTRTIGQYKSLVGQIKYTGSEHTGVILVSVDKNNAFVSGIADEKENFESARPDLLKTLSTFQYNNSLKDVSKVAGVVRMVPWKDPKEGAFTLNVPSGWNISGGTVRPYIDAATKIIATLGNKGIQIENIYSPIFEAPNAVTEFAGFPEGSHYNPSGGISQDMIIMSERNAGEYIRTLLPNYLNLNFKNIKSRPDIAEKITKLVYNTEPSVAEASATGNDGLIHKVLVTKQGMSISGIVLWYVCLTHYWAPESDISTVENIIEQMGNSFKIDSTWANREAQEVAKRSQIISQTGAEISDIISSTFEYQSQVQDKISDKFSNAMLGVEDVYNQETGESYRVPNTSNYYWTDGYNFIVGTETHDVPTNLDNWTELIPIE
ncbi:MAG: hypothetical protein ABH951_00350 [Patescibacteria group bacterium]